MSKVIELELKDIIYEIRINLKRAGWRKSDAKNYIILQYHKDGILKLTDDELLEFLEFCKGLPDEKPKHFKYLKFRKLPPSKIKGNQQSDDKIMF